MHNFKSKPQQYPEERPINVHLRSISDMSHVELKMFGRTFTQHFDLCDTVCSFTFKLKMRRKLLNSLKRLVC